MTVPFYLPFNGSLGDASPRLGATRAPDTGEAAAKKMAAVPNEDVSACLPRKWTEKEPW